MSVEQSIKELREINVGDPDLFFKVNDQIGICCIYLILSPSGKMYIGQTEHLVYRIYRYSKMKCSKQPKLFSSFEKYGWRNHRFFILKECLYEELNQLEDAFISEYNTFNTEHGLNLRTGGDHFRVSDETKEKLRKISTGKKYSQETNYKKGSLWRGKKIPVEIVEKMQRAQRNRSESHIRNHRAAARSGETNPMYGKRWTEEQKQAHGDKVRGKPSPMLGRKHSEETKAKMKGPRKSYTKRKIILSNES